MARFKASRFLKSPRAAKVVDPKAEAADDAGQNAEAETKAAAAPAAPAARMTEPMSTRPMAQPAESHVDTSRRVDPAQTMRRVDPEQTMRRVDPSARPTAPPREKADSSATTAADERGASGRVDAGAVGDADGSDSTGMMGKGVDDFTADDFTSRSSAEGFGSYGDSQQEAPEGAGRIPTDNGVESSLAADETTLVDPADLTNDGPEMPAGFDRSPGNLKTGNLSGLAGDADRYGSNSMAGASGFAEEDPDAASTTDTTQDDATSSDSNTQTEDDYGQREYLAGNSDGAGQSLDLDNMSDQEVADAVATEADYETVIRPGKEYLAGRDYDVDKMSNEEVVDALDKEAAYELSGGEGGTATSPSYVDADSGGEGSAQVAADATKLHVPTSPIRGNIDPTKFGNGGEEAPDTSILDMSDPVDSVGVSSGSVHTPPPAGNIDFGPDHVDKNPGGGPSDDIGGIGIGHDSGTLDVDLGTDDGTAFQGVRAMMGDQSRMAAAPDIGVAAGGQQMSGKPSAHQKSRLIDDKADSSATSIDDERGSGEMMDPGSTGHADGSDPEGPIGKTIDEYGADDFTSRSASQGFGRFDESTEQESPAGADQIPTDNGVQSSLAADETTLVDPADMTNDGPEMPADYDQDPGNQRTANLKGLAQDADTYGSNTMTDVGGLSGGAAEGRTASAGQGGDTAAARGGGNAGGGGEGSSGASSGLAGGGAGATTGGTSGGGGARSTDGGTSGGTPLSAGDKEYLKESGATAALEDAGYDVDSMTAGDVDDALGQIRDDVVAVDPGKDYLAGTGRGYDVENMSDDEIADALGKEAEYELQGGDEGEAQAPSVGYVDADSGSENYAQVSADAQRLNVTATTMGGDIDPSEFGNGAEEVADTSILDVSDPSSPDDTSGFGSGSVGAPPPTAGVDFGEDHVDQNLGSGPYEDTGGIGVGHDDGTVDIDLGVDDGAIPADDVGTMNDSIAMSDTPDVGFAIDTGDTSDIVDDAPVDVTVDEYRHVDHMDDMFE